MWRQEGFAAMVLCLRKEATRLLFRYSRVDGHNLTENSLPSNVIEVKTVILPLAFVWGLKIFELQTFYCLIQWKWFFSLLKSLTINMFFSIPVTLYKVWKADTWVELTMWMLLFRCQLIARRKSLKKGQTTTNCPRIRVPNQWVVQSNDS